MHDVFEYEEHEDGGFVYSIGNNNLTWDPVQRLWETSVNANGFIIEASTEFVEPDILFPPNYKSRVDSVQYLIQSDDGVEDQVFRLQITDAPDLLSIVTAPQPESLPLLYENTVLTLPMCGPGANFEGGDQKMIWKATNVRSLINFIDFVGGSTLYQEANMTGVVWVGGMAREIAGGIGVVEIYHR